MTLEKAIAEAVDELAEEGGGTVYVHAADCTQAPDVRGYECECQPEIVLVPEIVTVQ